VPAASAAQQSYLMNTGLLVLWTHDSKLPNWDLLGLLSESDVAVARHDRKLTFLEPSVFGVLVITSK
jgi:hypothetical protein